MRQSASYTSVKGRQALMMCALCRHQWWRVLAGSERANCGFSFHGRNCPGQLVMFAIIELSALMGCSAHASVLQVLSVTAPPVRCKEATLCSLMATRGHQIRVSVMPLPDGVATSEPTRYWLSCHSTFTEHLSVGPDQSFTCPTPETSES